MVFFSTFVNFVLVLCDIVGGSISLPLEEGEKIMLKSGWIDIVYCDCKYCDSVAVCSLCLTCS